MNLTNYEYAVSKTNNYDRRPETDFKVAVALAGEVGEFCNKLKKSADAEDLLDELGDVLWYLTAMVHRFGGSLEEVMQQNADKVLARQTAGSTYNLHTEK